MMEESIFKSCLKRKVKFTSGTFVKFLITGTVALSLTACGGGGGGGGSSSSGGNGGVIEKPSVENTKLSKETLVTENQIFTNKGNVNLTENKTEDSVVGIVGKNSDILNEAEIKIDDITVSNSKIFLASETGENILKKFQEKGKSFAIFAEGGSIANAEEGRLNITGDSVTGIVGVYSDIVNKGKIFTTDKIEDTKEAVGIMSIGSNVTNDGDINLVSYDGVGIWAFNNGADLDGIIVNSGKRISVINNGNISIKGEESRGIVADGADIDVVNNGNLSLEGIDVDGIVVQGNNISVKNNKGAEIVVTNNGTKENHEKIEYISGINIKKGQGNTVVNEGNITVSINTDDGVYVASGITSDEKVDITNSGTITVNSGLKPDIDENISFEEYIDNYSYGIKTNGKITNEAGGTINISGTAIGMTGKDITNNGTINITGIDAETDDGVKTPAGIFVSGSDSKATNNGLITGTKNFTVGMFAYDGATVINEKNGKITTARGFDGYNGHIINYGTVETTDHAAEIAGGTLTNYGTMSSTGEEVIFIDEIGTVINEKGGVIKISGDYVAGINAYIDEEDVQNGEIISGTKIINNGLIEVTSQNLESNPNEFGENHSTGIYLGTNDGTASVTNNGNITMSGDKSVGIFAYNGKIENNNGGKISITGDMGTGLYISGDGSASNSGEITVNGSESDGILAELKTTATNKGIVTILGENSSGMTANAGALVINETSGVINVNGTNSCGIYSKVEKAETTKEELNPELFSVNKGTINITGENSYGMVAQTINRENENLIGAAVLNGNEKDFKNAVINVTGNNSIGMYGSTADILNYGKINVTGENSVGMKTNGLAFADNYGTIAVTGNNSIGMSAENGGRVTNEKGGIINVKGNGSYAMKADGVNSWAVNEEGATINVGANAGGAMQATNSGKITNKGTINLEKREDLTENNKNGFAMIADNSSTIENNGEVFIKDALNIATDSTSTYIIGTNKDGSYGKVSAETVTVDGNVKVSAEMAKEGYKDSYALDNAIAGKTELKENYKLSSTSLLYNAVSKTDEEGNLDVELVRNDTDISDLASKEISKAAGIFDSAMKDETLSKKEKEILEKVFDSTSSAEGTDRAVKEVTGYNVYSNIARQIFDTKDMFVSYDKSIIDSLGDYNFNFNFIGNYADVNSKNKAAGYDSRVTGINGAVRFTDSLYGVIGYGYNDVDYDGSSDGTIETIHTGIYKDIKSQFGNIRTGIFGEYNFHETDRKVFDEKTNSDFNSYLVGANVEISRKFGDDLYIKPALSFDLSYGKYEDFKEDGGADVKFEKQDYVSAVPGIELKLGKEFETSEIYGAVKYSYELGDLNKEQEIEFLNGKAPIHADNIEDAQTDVKFGASFNIKNISVNAELGKEFGKRDREYVKAGISYTF